MRDSKMLYDTTAYTHRSLERERMINRVTMRLQAVEVALENLIRIRRQLDRLESRHGCCSWLHTDRR